MMRSRAVGSNSILEKLFNLKKEGTTIKTEVIAGATTFMTMAYILALNPAMLSQTGMDAKAVFTATAVSAIVGTLVMAFYANLPIGLASGVGASAFFAFTIVLAMGHTWQFALTAVLLEGIVFILLTLFKIREAIVNCIPSSMRYAITIGIGLFITFIGLVNAGVIQTGMHIAMGGEHLEGIPIKLGMVKTPSVILTLCGVILIGFLLHKKVKGALLISMLIITFVGIFFGVTKLPHEGFSPVSLPPSLTPLFFKFQFHHIFSFDMLVTVIVLLFMELFDTLGTLLAVTTKAKLVDSKGNVKNIKQALLSDAIGTTAGAFLGTSTVTAYVESCAGVAEGGKTGLTAFVIAIFFFLALFISPIFLLVPSCATSPILIIVGLFMIEPVKEMNLDDFTESIPFFLTLIMIPLTYSIADGILIGMIAYVVIKLISGKYKQLNWIMVLMAILFSLKLIFFN